MKKQEQATNSLTPIGITDFRGMRQSFYIKDKDRLSHIYVLGKTGVGKSTLLESMAVADIEHGNGMCLIDPHGDVSGHLLHYIPEHRIADVIYFNPGEYSIPFNPLAGIEPAQRHLAAAGMVSTLKKTFSSWGPRLEHTLLHSLHTLLEAGGTLLDIHPLLTDPLFRNTLLCRVNTPYLQRYWRNEFDKYSPGLRSEVIAPILNKVSLFQTSDPLRNTVGHKTSSFGIQQVMDEGKILIANLSKANLGEEASSLLGSLLVNSIQLAALARANQDIETRRPFYLYVDECHCFMSEAYVGVLAECRKYGLGLFLAHQYVEQLDQKIQSAIFGNVGTMICFRIGAADAKEYLAKEFYPVFNESDLINLPKYSMYLKMQIEAATSKPFSATTLPLKPITNSLKEIVIEASRKKYGRESAEIENNVCNERKNLAEDRTAAGLFDRLQ